MADEITAWGVTDEGFICPTYEEILSYKIQQAKNLFGDDIATSELTPLGKLLRISAATERKLYETAESVYYSVSPATATGVALDRVCSFARATRNAATCARHKIRVFGTPGHSIQAGTLFKSESGVMFYSVQDAVISEYEGNINDIELYYAEVTVQCVDAGTAGNVYTINAPVLIDNDISFVEYVSTISAGENVETDPELRERYNKIITGLGSNTAASIIANVLRQQGVHACIIKNNNTLEDVIISGALTISPGSYAIIIYAEPSAETEIARAIYEKMPFGVYQSGAETVIVTDEAGEQQPVRFTYVSEKTADIEIECTVTDEFESTGISQLQTNIAAFINALGIGKDLIYSKLYKEIYSVTGVEEVTSLTINNGTENITADDTEIIRSGTIAVTVTGV